MADDKKEACTCMDIVLEKLDDHNTDLRKFLIEWREHRKEAITAMVKIDSVHAAVIPLARNSENLKILPQILEAMVEVKDKLIAPATGVGRTDNKTMYMLIGFSVFTIFAFFSIIVIDRLRDSNTSIGAKTSLGELSISGSNGK